MNCNLSDLMAEEQIREARLKTCSPGHGMGVLWIEKRKSISSGKAKIDAGEHSGELFWTTSQVSLCM